MIIREFEKSEWNYIDLIKTTSFQDLNEMIEQKTGFLNFFPSEADIKEFLGSIERETSLDVDNQDLGDFQTPLDLSDRLCTILKNDNYEPEIILEPTCGKGNFIFSALEIFPSIKIVIANDIQKKYEWLFKKRALNYLTNGERKIKVFFFHENALDDGFFQKIKQNVKLQNKEILILGNPPWITNSGLALLESTNLPVKSNFKKVKGIEAITGKSNFDIAESIMMRLIQHFSMFKARMAMLCKTIVVRNIVQNIHVLNFDLSRMQEILIDADKEFKVSADACFFIASLGANNEQVCDVRHLADTSKLIKKMGWVGKKFVSDVDLYKENQFLDGKCSFTWRQGIKHDVRPIVVLHAIDGHYENGLNEHVTVEDDLVYPFLKGSKVHSLVAPEPIESIIITQRALNDEPGKIKYMYPDAWNYLQQHVDAFQRRKSSIYRDKPQFSIFGIGEYSFFPYKIGVASMYKDILFSYIPPFGNKPVLLDDTSYFLSFNNENVALIIWVLLNSALVRDFLKSIVFLDSKRPYTKDNLMRLNVSRYLADVTYERFMDLYRQDLEKEYKFVLGRDEFYRCKKRIIQPLLTDFV
nr:hypothetical protein [Candidatus Sigynarchaeota archaeon]